MLRSVDALKRLVHEPLSASCGPQARMLTAEVHGGLICGLAICPGRVVRYVMDDKTQRPKRSIFRWHQPPGKQPLVDSVHLEGAIVSPSAASCW